MVTFKGMSPPRTLPTPPWRRRTLCPLLISLSFFFLFHLLQSRQCLFEVKSALHWHSLGTCLVRTKPAITFLSNIVVESNGGSDLRPQEHPFVDKHLRLDHFRSFDCGIFHLVWICHGHPVRTSSSAGWQQNIPVSRLLTVSISCEVVLSFRRSQEWKRGPSCTWWISDVLLFLHARSARTCNRRCHCPSVINIPCTALGVPSRAIHTIQCFQPPESFVLILDKRLNDWFCRKYC